MLSRVSRMHIVAGCWVITHELRVLGKGSAYSGSFAKFGNSKESLIFGAGRL
ncbi:hypothetical protein EV356DRAFT_497287 [Viridothelium virens]|uniref:Uncharacterized protein n=1 Tax=Viridothelium virens TaxID=1048519 RepID=A0A6A6HGC7_VIRVR|nr:hypothetical protein EV356DRAFT_497287 [Viridothelium virens]